MKRECHCEVLFTFLEKCYSNILLKKPKQFKYLPYLQQVMKVLLSLKSEVKTKKKKAKNQYQFINP